MEKLWPSEVKILAQNHVWQQRTVKVEPTHISSTPLQSVFYYLMLFLQAQPLELALLEVTLVLKVWK